jgi:hypothetical protein
VGFRADFDATNKILRITFEGRLTDAVAFDCSAAAKRWAASCRPDHVIVDLSKVTKYDVTAQAIRRFATKPDSSFPAAPTLLVVAPQANAYGMSRMYQLLTEFTRSNQHVLHTIDEAYERLQVQSPEFRPLSSAKTD